MDSSAIQFLTRTAYNRFAFPVVIAWTLIGVILFSVFMAITSEPNLTCVVEDDVNKNVIKEECLKQYKDRFENSFPFYWFVILNFSSVGIVSLVYSLVMKSRVDEVSRQNAVEEPLLVNDRPVREKHIFVAYCLQLAFRFSLNVVFIVVQTQMNFPLKHMCKLNQTSTSTADIYECLNSRASISTRLLYSINAVFAILILIEILIIAWKTRKDVHFTEDSQFYTFYLLSKSRRPLGLKEFLDSMKKSIREGTKELDPLFQAEHGCGERTKKLALDQIYTNLVINEGKVNYDFTGNRHEILNEYPKQTKQSSPMRPQDIIGATNKHVLILGRAGIGKTVFCEKLLRDWACDKVFVTENEEVCFEFGFLFKFRRFNEGRNFNLCELLTKSEYQGYLTNEVFQYILEHPSKVLLIFDGLDEFNYRENITDEDNCSDSNVEKMPLSSLYHKLASGRLLKEATVLTSSRPTALSSVQHIEFDKTVELLGFTSQSVEEYVKGFTISEDKGVLEKVWQHISSNFNIFSLCYIPVNCYIVCSCLFEILSFEPPNSSDKPDLPTTLTEIYKRATKLFLLKHSRRLRNKYNCHQDLVSYDFPREMEDELKPLTEIAYNGVEQGKLIFEANEVKKASESALLHHLPDLRTGAFEYKSQYCFIHLTLQEFLAAKHIVDTMNVEKLRGFITSHISVGTWEVVLQFVAGLLSERREKLMIEIFINLLPTSVCNGDKARQRDVGGENSNPRILTQWPATTEDQTLTVTLSKCIFEYRKFDSETKPNVETKLNEIGCTSVDFTLCGLLPTDCSAILNLVRICTRISDIRIPRNYIGDLGCKQIGKLLGIRRLSSSSIKSDSNYELSTLDLSENGITDEGVKHLSGALSNSNCKLNKLDLSNNTITDEGVKHLSDALSNSNCKLSKLNIFYNKITDEGVKHLSDALSNNNCKLSKLDLSRNEITDEGVKLLSDSLSNSNCKLSKLGLSENEITDEGVKHLSGALSKSNCKLSKLDLCNNTITDEGVKHLSDSLSNSNCKLSKLYLIWNKITDEGVKHLSDALSNSNCKLSKLDLCANKITDEGVKHLSDALSNTNCKLSKLDLSNNTITAEGVKHLSYALSNSNCKLSKLDLSDNEITDEGVKHLSDALSKSNCKLSKLDLSAIKITDEGVKHLSDALSNSNCKLSKLDLSRNKIIDEGVKHLSDAVSNSNCKLSKLDLSNNKIADEGVKHLSDALSNSHCKIWTGNGLLSISRK